MTTKDKSIGVLFTTPPDVPAGFDALLRKAFETAGFVADYGHGEYDAIDWVKVVLKHYLSDIKAERDTALARVAELEKPQGAAVRREVWDTARMSDAVPSRWDVGSTYQLWAADDARPPDAETARQAWSRLFGSNCDDEPVLAKADHGDAFASLYSRGRILWATCEGARIEQLTFMPDESKEGGA